MLFTSRKLIFLHVPKTAGNFVTRTLIGQSDDKMILGDKQDGIDRMKVEGPMTLQKHQSLTTYAQFLGGDLTGWDVVLFARPPLERLLSMYFSPGRWLKPDADGTQVLRPPEEVHFYPKTFESIVDLAPSIHNMVGLKRVPIKPARQLKLGRASAHKTGARIRVFDHRATDDLLPEIARDYDLSLSDLPEKEVNVSANAVLKEQLRSDSRVIEMLENSHHALDATIFEA